MLEKLLQSGDLPDPTEVYNWSLKLEVLRFASSQTWTHPGSLKRRSRGAELK